MSAPKGVRWPGWHAAIRQVSTIVADARRSSGSIRVESAVDPTRSANITVTCRRSAVSLAVMSVAGRASGGFRARVGAQGGDGVEQLAAVPDNIYAKILQVLRCQVRQDRVIDRVLAECNLILSEAKAPQPTSDGGALTWLPDGPQTAIN